MSNEKPEFHERLKNGALVLLSKPAKGGGRIVLARITAYHPLVTWLVNDEGEAVSGRYFLPDEAKLAIRDFEVRH